MTTFDNSGADVAVAELFGYKKERLDKVFGWHGTGNKGEFLGCVGKQNLARCNFVW